VNVVAVLTAVVALAAAAIAYGRYGYHMWRWGCPSQADLGRLLSAQEVQDAFARRDLELTRITRPSELRHARSYDGAVVLRHQRRTAAVTVIVCRARCGITRFQIRPGIPRRRYRGGYNLRNVVDWVAADDRRSQAQLLPAVRAAMDDLDPSPAYGSRCYVG
jgi:hypothetical protein